jgi:metal-responsive CopG/Arc/MetJ family transcriptional regulator
MFEPDTWKRLSELVDELREMRGVRSSRNALLISVLADGLPSDEDAALDLVGRHDLELADRGGYVRRRQHTVKLPELLLEPLDRLGRAARAHGFAGGRSAIINAILALRGPKSVEEAERLVNRARRARAAAVVHS